MATPKSSLWTPKSFWIRTWNDEQFRQDTMNAINLLMMQKRIDPETHYDLVYDSRGRARVRLGMEREVSPGKHEIVDLCPPVDPLDLITAAGKLALVRGNSDEL